MSESMLSYVESEMIRLGLASPRAPEIVEIASNANEPEPEPVAATEPEPEPAVVVEYPSEMTGYVKPEWYERFALYMTDDEFSGASLFGPRGTGKTSAVRQLAAELKQPLIVFQCAGGQTIDDLVGVRDIRDGRTVFTPGPITLALMHNCWIALEEVNNLATSIPATFNTLTDKSGTPLRTKDGKMYYPGDKFKVVLCYNDGYAGTREVNVSLSDRLRPIYCGYMSEQDEARILVNKMGIDETSAQSLASLAKSCRASFKTTQFDFSPRTLFAMVRLKKCLKCQWIKAFEYAVLDCCGSPNEKATQRSVLSGIASINNVEYWNEPTFK